jgi:hypothetical protein
LYVTDQAHFQNCKFFQCGDRGCGDCALQTALTNVNQRWNGDAALHVGGTVTVAGDPFAGVAGMDISRAHFEMADFSHLHLSNMEVTSQFLTETMMPNRRRLVNNVSFDTIAIRDLPGFGQLSGAVAVIGEPMCQAPLASGEMEPLCLLDETCRPHGEAADRGSDSRPYMYCDSIGTRFMKSFEPAGILTLGTPIFLVSSGPCTVEQNGHCVGLSGGYGTNVQCDISITGGSGVLDSCPPRPGQPPTLVPNWPRNATMGKELFDIPKVGRGGGDEVELRLLSDIKEDCRSASANTPYGVTAAQYVVATNWHRKLPFHILQKGLSRGSLLDPAASRGLLIGLDFATERLRLADLFCVTDATYDEKSISNII